MAKKVIIVKIGVHGDQSTVSAFVELLKEALEEAEVPVLRQGQEKKERAAEVFVVPSWKEGVLKAGLQDSDMPDTVLVFMTGEMLAEAERIQKFIPRLRVVVFTGLCPQARVIVAPKSPDPAFMQQVVLTW